MVHPACYDSHRSVWSQSTICREAVERRERGEARVEKAQRKLRQRNAETWNRLRRSEATGLYTRHGADDRPRNARAKRQRPPTCWEQIRVLLLRVNGIPMTLDEIAASLPQCRRNAVSQALCIHSRLGDCDTGLAENPAHGTHGHARRQILTYFIQPAGTAT